MFKPILNHSYAILLSFFMLSGASAYAWKHETSIGYNHSKEIGYNYYNYGVFLNAKLHKFDIAKTLIFTIDGSIASWHATTNQHNSLDTIGAGGGFKAYFISPKNRTFNPYLSASFGPVYLLQKKFGDRELGNNFAFQTTLGIGTEFIFNNNKGLDFSLQLAHYCNAGLSPINRGINMLYIFSIGYMF